MEELTQTFRREIKREIKDNKEYVEYDYFKGSVFTKDEINTIADMFNDDCEDAFYTAGICFNFEGDLFCMEVDKFLESLEERKKEKEEYYLELDEMSIEKIRKWKGYEIWF